MSGCEWQPTLHEMPSKRAPAPDALASKFGSPPGGISVPSVMSLQPSQVASTSRAWNRPSLKIAI
jgi:hypothetical protein